MAHYKFYIVLYCIVYLVSQAMASSSAECSLDKPPWAGFDNV